MSTRQRSVGSVILGLVAGRLVAWWWLARAETPAEPIESSPREESLATIAREPPSPQAIARDATASAARLERVDLTIPPLPEPPVEVSRGLIFGSVTDRAGAPVPSFSVSIESLPDTTGRRGRDAESSSYTLRVPRAGAYDVVCVAHGFMTRRQSVLVAPKSSRTRLDFQLDPTIPVVVHLLAPNGKSLAEELRNQEMLASWIPRVALVATRDHPGDRWTGGAVANELATVRPGNGKSLAVALASSEGRELEFDRILELKTPPPLFVSAVLGATVVLGTALLDRPVERLDLVVAPERLRSSLGRITFRAVDAVTTRPIGSLFTQVFAMGVAQVFAMGVASTSNRTDRNGVTTIRDQVPGHLRIEASANGYAPWRQDVDLEPGQNLDLGTIVLDEGMVLRGEVRDPDGKPVDYGWMSLVPLLDDQLAPASKQLGEQYRLDSRGEFTIPWVGRGRYSLLVNTQAWAAASVVVDTTGGPLDPLRIALKRGTRISFKLGAVALLRRQVAITDDGGYFIAALSVQNTREPVSLVLAPGRYTVTARDERGNVQRVTPLLVTGTAATVMVDDL